MTGPAEFNGAGAEDPLLQQAIDIVKKAGRPSTSLVQRSLRIGWGRADRMLAAMEPLGIVKRNTGPTGAPWRLA